MKIKNKLRLGFGFLFAALLIFGGVAIYYIEQITNNTRSILSNNYETLEYIRAMRTVLDENPLPLSAGASAAFRQQLNRQEHNITEKGEAELTRQLQVGFNQLSTPGAGTVQLQQTGRQVRRLLRTIEGLNMQAIIKNNGRARASVDDATAVLGVVGLLTFLLLLSFSVSFPGVVAGPLQALLQGIHEISQKNYRRRLSIGRNDELGELAAAFNTMAGRLHEWENSNLATVMSEKRRIEAIIEQMQDAIIGIDENQEVLFMNDASRRLLQLPEGRLTGRQVQELAQSNALLAELLTGRPELEPISVMAGGKEAYYQLERREIKVPNLSADLQEGIRVAGKSAGRVYVLKNITQYKERDEAKTNFIATISHELKTPIASIKMSLKLLDDERVGALNAEQQDLLTHIREDNDRLLKLTSELLNTAQVETGNIQLNFVPVKPAQLVDYALNSMRFQAGQKDVQLNFVRNENLPAVHADVEKTTWVMVNLLSNALRYSPGHSKVTIRTIEQKGYVEFSVQDEGKGIDPQYQKHLFDRYFQVPADAQNKTGSGLGLAISRDFIEAQNGSIRVESTPGKGSTFSFVLPKG